MPHALSAADMLTVWEHGAATDSARRARGMLAVSDTDIRELDDMTLGQRDLELLDVYRKTFGDVLHARSRCPYCDEHVAIALDADQITFGTAEPHETPPLRVVVGETVIDARPPNVALLLAAADAGSVADAREVLIRGCVRTVHRGGVRLDDVTRLPDEVVAAVGEAILETDPQSEVQLDLTCAFCSAPWTATLDIATFLWDAVIAEGRRVVEQVHALARAYGWSEAESLRLSTWRRQVYVERALDD